MAQCCITLAPSVKVSASAGEAGCVPSTPRDLEGSGYLVTFYYFVAAKDQTDFMGADKNGNVFAGDESSLLFVNGVMLDDDCYLMNNTSFRLADPCQTDEDIVSAVVFRAPSGDDGATDMRSYAEKTYVDLADESVLVACKNYMDNSHYIPRGFADARYQRIQKQIVFKCDQYATCSTNPTPAPGEFCGLNNSSPGSSTTPNPYFGNFNAGIRVSTDKLLNPEGNQFSEKERYEVLGTVTIFDSTGKMYFKSSVSSVSRTNNNSYVDIQFGSRIPAFGTGSYNASDQYVLIIEGLENERSSIENTKEHRLSPVE